MIPPQDILICHNPKAQVAPLVLDSPHSGTVYPADFGYACPFSWLRETEDGFIDELFGAAPAHGVPLLTAQFPRCYIDVNRAVDDIDPLLLGEPWQGSNPTARSAMGVGLIRRLHKQASPQPLYDRLLTRDEIQRRIDGYYTPYHLTLEELLMRTYADFGAAYHLNCHSMPGSAGPDMVLGDRDGTTCTPALTRFVAQQLKGMGYRVAINRPYKGVELVRRFGRPAAGWHSLQIELRRGLYMNEVTREKGNGFSRLQANMTRLIDDLVDFTRKNSIDLAAD
ncbi:MAG: N-formylglutamate amidohydrolase [Micavibrio sp.]|nr:N-formylglutamate amidohydrolase [Micavibrio sp.]